MQKLTYKTKMYKYGDFESDTLYDSYVKITNRKVLHQIDDGKIILKQAGKFFWDVKDKLENTIKSTNQQTTLLKLGLYSVPSILTTCTLEQLGSRQDLGVKNAHKLTIYDPMHDNTIEIIAPLECFDNIYHNDIFTSNEDFSRLYPTLYPATTELMKDIEDRKYRKLNIILNALDTCFYKPELIERVVINNGSD